MSRVAAYQHFKERLLSGELSPGQFITQKEFAKLAGVPVGTAREAIQKLEHESLLKVHPQRGIQIADVTTKFILEAFGLRKILELQAVLHFASGECEMIVKDLIAKTSEVLEVSKTDQSEEILERAVEVDWEMHDKIIEGCENDLLTEVYQINVARLRLIKVSNRMTPKRSIEALGEHLDILNHCLAQEGAKAAEALGGHIDIAMNRALRGK